jgi:hypothetical protein
MTAKKAAPKVRRAPARELYTVNRVQDGAEVRRELGLSAAEDEVAMLNAQARVTTGQTIDGFPIYGSMIRGEISRYEIRSMSGLVLA